MRMPLLLILPVLILDVLIDWYICRAVWQRCRSNIKFWRGTALWSSVALTLFMIVLVAWPKKSVSDSGLASIMWLLYAYFSIYIPKYFFVVCDLLAKIPQLFGSRRIKALSVGGIVLAVVSCALMWWGSLVNRWQIDVKEVEFTDSRVPAGFDGYRIVQLSDIHTGTYGTDTAFLAEVVERVNELKPDVVLFTGDIVNRRSEELEPFVSTLSRIEAPVYSILGNHDYGDYYKWTDDAEKAANQQYLYDMQRDMGWQLLNNESRTLYAGGDSLVLIGVENIGDPPFPVYGDLDAAYPGDLADPAFKILMSHNPAHWVEDIKDSPDKNIALTLSGHTHAMQMELFGVSPAAFRYQTWGGMYADEDAAHRLYVNIGLGEVGIPARIGATPEITLISLRRGN